MKAGETIIRISATDERTEAVEYLGKTAEGLVAVRNIWTGIIEVKASHWFIEETKNVRKKIT